MHSKVHFLILLIGLCLTSCGSDSGKTPETENSNNLSNNNTKNESESTTNSANWKICNPELVKDYIKLEEYCAPKNSKNREIVKSCINLFNKIKAEQPSDLHCLSEINKKDYSPIITLTILESTRGSFTYENYFQSTDDKKCGRFPEEDFFKISNDCKKSNLETAYGRNTCATTTREILKDYKSIMCFIPITETHSYSFNRQWVIEQQQASASECDENIKSSVNSIYANCIYDELPYFENTSKARLCLKAASIVEEYPHGIKCNITDAAGFKKYIDDPWLRDFFHQAAEYFERN